MKLPYGEANFEKIRTEGYFYVDKTRYIELLEQLPESHVVILRSRRFGKTLFANMLQYYYDQRHADRFETLFKGTYIYDHPTPKHNTYMILSFNFSGINTETLENANEGFTFEVRRNVESFMTRYKTYFTPEDRQNVLHGEKPNDMLSALFQKVHDNSLVKNLYVIIDEYDHFANNILSQGKQMFKDLVRTDGYVRPFYEALKKGTEHVVDRLFITGVMPILLDSLTSGFNIGTNLSTDDRFNEMFGFTEEEITPVLDHLGQEHARDMIRTYYDGYRFSPHAARTVYNSDMILYYGLHYHPERQQIDSMIDVNVVSDYRKIRAILSIGERELEETVLTRIVQENEVTVSEITQLFVLTQETEFLFTEESLCSLLFYMGYLTIAGKKGISLVLTMPNLVMESLYLDYMEYMLMKRGELRLDSREKLNMLQDLVDGKIDALVGMTEKLLKGLSNRDYERFGEKYIKVVMLSLLSNINIYIPKSEYEVSADGYVDLYLQAAFEPEHSAHYFIELKYAKADVSSRTLNSKEQQGIAAMQTYLQSDTARAISNLQGYVLLFRKDRCVRKIRCSGN